MSPLVSPRGLLCSLWCLLAFQASASSVSDEAEKQYPHFSGSILVELQNDGAFSSDERSNELNDLYTTIEPAVALHFTDWISLETALTFEPMKGPSPHESREFQTQGLFVEELFVRVTHDRFDLRGGKINPRFGAAWEMAPGVYGVDVAEAEYELTEMLGAELVIDLGNRAVPSLELSGSLFFADNTALSSAAFNDRYYEDEDGDLHKRNHSDYIDRLANTGSPESFSLTLRGTEMEALPGLTFDVGVARLAAADGLADEVWASGALAYERNLTEELELFLFNEYVYKNDAYGVGGGSAHVVDLGARLDWKGWNTAVNWGYTRVSPDSGTHSNGHLLQASAGYAFDCGLGIDLAYRVDDVDGVTTHGIGLLIGYKYSF